MKSKSSLKVLSVLLSVFLVVSMVPTMVFAGSEDPVKILTQPESITAFAGDQWMLNVVAENATSYQWQRSSDNGQNWSNIGSTNSNYTNAKTDTMTVKVNKTTAGFVYKCVVKNSAGSVSTEIASITLIQLLQITAQPSSITGISGEEQVMHVSAANASSYQWQRSSDNGETWSNIGSSNSNYTNAKTDTLTIKINKTTAGFVYRCVVKNSENTVNSEIATVTVILPVVIKTDPKDISAPSGEEKIMSVVAENATSYQWQRSSDNGENWSNIGSTNSNYTSAKTDTMTIKVNKTTAGFVYRCMVKNNAFTEYSKKANVTVAEPVQELKIKEQPQSITGPVGASWRVTVVADNATSYQWQRSSDGETWSNISTSNPNYSGVKTKTIIITISKTTAGFVYRCVVKNSTSSVISNVISVNISQTVKISEEPKDISGRIGEERFTHVVSNNATSYQWQRSSDGETWSNISVTNPNYIGAKNAYFTVKISKTTAGYVYRCILKNDAGDSVISRTVTVEILTGFTVTFDGNGGSFDGELTRTEFAEADSYIFNDSLMRPTRDGYIFDGWCLDAAGKTPMGFSYFVTEDVTLYARWKEAYIITFKANGGVFDFGEQTCLWPVEKNTYLSVSPSPYKEGYILVDWCLDAECTQSANLWDGNITGDMTVYAKWVEEVIIVFDANGGNFSGGELTEALSYAKGSLVSGYSFPRKGNLVFDGWYFDAACTLPVDTKEYVATEDVTFYAKYDTPISITWDANGGTIYTDEATFATYTEEVSKYQEIALNYYVSKDGCELEGWYLDPQFEERVDFYEYVLTGDVTFYAKWVYEVTVTWNANGGWVLSGGQSYDQKVSIGSYLYPPEAYRVGYVLEGWYLDEDCTQEFDFYEQTIDGDLTLYANWVESVVVTFDANGGCYADGSLTKTKNVVKNGKTYDDTHPIREGYTLVDWCFDAACTKVVDLGSYVVTEDVTFYAKWEKAVTVTWNGNGGLVDNEPEIVENAEFNCAIGYTRPGKRDGYILAGWYLDSACTQSVDPQTYVVTRNVTFYAKWVAAVNLTWDGNGGLMGWDLEYSTYTEPFEKGRILSYSMDVKKPGFYFVGWCLDPNSDECINFGEFVVSEDVTLYAKWSEGATVTWDGNGGYIWGDPECPVYTKTVPKNKTLNYSEDAQKPGFVLVGWCLDPNGGECINLNEYVVSGDVTLYAIWSEAVNVTWVGNGGYFYGDPDSQTLTEPFPKNVEASGAPYVEKPGYFFDGWYYDEACTRLLDESGFVVTGDTSFYAKWVVAVNVTWDANGGYFWGDPDSQTYTQPFPKNGEMKGTPYIEKPGYMFDGWYLDQSCTQKADPMLYVLSQDVTFYAKWVIE